jgi:hypothetical protein
LKSALNERSEKGKERDGEKIVRKREMMQERKEEPERIVQREGK